MAKKRHREKSGETSSPGPRSGGSPERRAPAQKSGVRGSRGKARKTAGASRSFRSDPVLVWLLVLAILVILVISVSLLKLDIYKSIPAFNPSDDTGLFTSESAFHYRYSRMAASGREIPSVDLAAQWPEGLNVGENITVLMEYVPAFLNRLMGGPSAGPYHVFLIGFICSWSSLSIFPLYFLSLKIWSSKWSALASALFYAFSVVAFDRTFGNFLREDFTLPFIFGSLAFFVYSVSEKNEKRALAFSVLSGLCLFVALGAWHLTQFYFVLFSVGVALCAVLQTERTRLLLSFAVVTLFAVGAGLTFQVLRERLFFLSHPLVVSYALLFMGWLARKRDLTRTRFASLLIPVALGAGLVFWLLTRSYLEYSHVYSLMLEKIRHFGVKPAVPSSISYDARVFWQGPFNSPSARSALFYFGHLVPVLALSAGALVAGLKRKAFPLERTLLVFFVVTFLVLYLLIDRMGVFLVFFVCVAVGGAARQGPSTTGYLRFGTLRLSVGVFVVAICLAVGTYETASYRSRAGIVGWYSRAEAGSVVSTAMGSDLDRARLTEWIRQNTDSTSVFLTWMAQGSDLLKDTGRPINIHSMFEAADIREKNREFLKALYSTEDEFLSVFERFKSDYFVYRADFVLDESEDSERYIADALRLPRASAAFEFHFEPDSLQHFRCVYENRFFRVYALRSKELPPLLRVVRRGYNGLFELSLFEPGGSTGEYFDDSNVTEVLTKLTRAVEEHSAAMNLYAQGRVDEAYEGLKSALSLDPGIAAAWSALASISAARGDLNGAVSQLEECLRIEPENPGALANTGYLFVARGEFDEGIELLKKAAVHDPANGVIHFNLGEAYFALGRFDEARAEYELAIERNPGIQPAYVALGRIYASQNRFDLAVGFWQTALQLNPNDSTAQALLQRAVQMLSEQEAGD